MWIINVREREKSRAVFCDRKLMRMHFPFILMSDPLTSMGDNFHSYEIFLENHFHSVAMFNTLSLQGALLSS